jgi:tetratricopeptide (TPR) repeat protein
VVFVFGQTVGHGFVNYDDDHYVYQNPCVERGLTAAGIVWAFTTTQCYNWHPLTWLSHMLDCQAYGLHAGGHHLTNVLLHAATAILLFLVLWRMTGDLWPSAFAAALFAIHPLRVESVAWVAERKDLLSGLFFMLTLGAYVAYARHPFSLLRYLTVVGLFALGLMAKPMLVTLPCVLLLLDYWPLGRLESPPRESQRTLFIPWRLVVEKLPLFALSAASCVVTPLVQADAIQSIEKFSLASRLGNAPVAYVTYLGQFFCPAGLAPFYPHSGSNPPTWQLAGALLLLVCICVGLLFWRAKYPHVLVGWFWYLGMLVPVIGLVQVGEQSMADRYTYLPQIGLAIALAWGAKQAFGRWAYPPWGCGVASALLMVALMGCVWRQTSYWCNAETLWTHTLDCTSPNAVAQCNLGVALGEQGRFDDAVPHLQEALRIRPCYAEAENSLAVALVGRGQVKEAMSHYQKALEIKPDFAEAHNNFGMALVDCGQVEEGLRHCRKALEIKPDYVDALNNLGVVLAGHGQVEEAIAHYQRALEIKPDFAEVHNNFGNALVDHGQVDEAVAHYRKALEVKPDYAQAHNNLGIALARRAKLEEAVTEFRNAVKIEPNYAEAHKNLGNALAGQARLDEAIAEYRKALAIKPDYAEVHMYFGNALVGQAKLDEAAVEYRKALHVKPDYAEVHMNLGNVLARQAKVDEAIAEYRKALDIKPDRAEAHRLLGTFDGGFAIWWTGPLSGGFCGHLSLYTRHG